MLPIRTFCAKDTGYGQGIKKQTTTRKAGERCQLSILLSVWRNNARSGLAVSFIVAISQSAVIVFVDQVRTSFRHAAFELLQSARRSCGLPQVGGVGALRRNAAWEGAIALNVTRRRLRAASRHGDAARDRDATRHGGAPNWKALAVSARVVNTFEPQPTERHRLRSSPVFDGAGKICFSGQEPFHPGPISEGRFSFSAPGCEAATAAADVMELRRSGLPPAPFLTSASLGAGSTCFSGQLFFQPGLRRDARADTRVSDLRRGTR